MKKIGFITDARAVWGAEKSLLGLASHAAMAGYSATIICPASSPIRDYVAKMGIDVEFQTVELVRHPAFAGGGLRATGLLGAAQELAATARAARQVRLLADQYDVLVSFETWRNLEVSLGCLGSRCKAVIDMHDVFAGKLGRSLNRMAHALSALAITPSEYTMRRTGLIPRRTAIVPRGTEMPQSRDERSSGVSAVVAILGEVRAYKRVDVFCEAVIHAAAAFEPGMVRGWIVGEVRDDEVGNQVRRLVAESGGVIELKGRSDDVFDVLRRVDVIVNASAEEAFGRTMIEGLASGAVPVSFGRSGPAEIISTAGLGRVIDSERPANEIGAELAQVIADEELRARARRTGLEVAREHFSWERVSRRYFGAIAACT